MKVLLFYVTMNRENHELALEDAYMNCLETVARLHLYIDRELTVEEIEIVQRHLEDCSDCDCRFHFDMKIKRLIHDHCAMERAPEQLRQAVLSLAHTPAGEPVAFEAELEVELRAEFEDCE
jgi:mycothiol system anti-sigma-R factor